MARQARHGAAWPGKAWQVRRGRCGMSTLRDQLQAIYDDAGTLTPALVVDAARDPKHPLHSRLEWDDSAAAEKYRLDQAAALIRSVRITYADNPTGPKDLRAFTAIKGRDSHKADYVPTEVAMANPFTRQLVLRQMERDWRTFKRRYEHMTEFADLIARELEGETA